jgi:hypothetical protein
MNSKFIILTVALLATTATPATDGLKISIQGATKTKGEIQFLVLIENLRPSSVFLEETREGGRDPYAINIEQLQPDSTWVSIGPRRDIPPADVFELKSHTKVEKTITIVDPYVDLRSAPQKRFAIRGQHRASIRYFLSSKDWDDFKRNLRQGPKLVYSEVDSAGEGATVDH